MIERYFYLIWTGIVFLLWLTLFYFRKDVRKEMIILSFLFGIAGVFSELIYVIDWWRPLTITGTLVGIEDFFIGAFIGGIGAVLYEEVYGMKLKRKKGRNHFYKHL